MTVRRLDPGRPSFGYVNGNYTFSGILGSWVEVVLDDVTNLLNTDVTCEHDLGVVVRSASQPNVRWLKMGFQHDGTGAGAGSVIDIGYQGGIVTADSIQLRFYAAARTVTVAHPLKVALWFCPAVLGIAQ